MRWDGDGDGDGERDEAPIRDLVPKKGRQGSRAGHQVAAISLHPNDNLAELDAILRCGIFASCTEAVMDIFRPNRKCWL